MRAFNRLQAALHQAANQAELRNLSIYKFRQLATTASVVQRKFGSFDIDAIDPYEKRKAAVIEFLREGNLKPRSWRLVFSSLSDVSIDEQTVIESPAQFERVLDYANSLLEQNRLSKRDWSALCYSYFSFDATAPQAQENFIRLRATLQRGFSQLSKRFGDSRQWISVIKQYQEVFTEEPASKLASELLCGDITDLSVLNVAAQVPPKSWLWQQVFNQIGQQILAMGQETFLQSYEALIERFIPYELHYDQILAACLTRYSLLTGSRPVSEVLKSSSYERWGSPQLKTKQIRWLQYVEQPVMEMVCAWFAEEDLKDFFNLLKDDTEVDESRLYYWLRFTGQMKYTRIVLGRAAANSMDPDFVAFRKRNKGRYSELKGSTIKNNAVIMHIGNCFFVEFSQTGNACYAYKKSDLPFNPEKQQLDLNYELKVKYRALWSKSHTPRPSVPRTMDGWLLRYDEALAEQKIYSDDHVASVKARASAMPAVSKPNVNASVKSNNTVNPARANAKETTSLSSSTSRGKLSNSVPADDDIDMRATIARYLGETGYSYKDNRAKGGAITVMLDVEDYYKAAVLTRLGFKELNSNPLKFWKN